MAVGLAGLGLATTVVSITLALIPAHGDPNKLLAVSKTRGLALLLVAVGALVYRLGRRRVT